MREIGAIKGGDFAQKGGFSAQMVASEQIGKDKTPFLYYTILGKAY